MYRGASFPHRRDLQVHMITHCKGQISTTNIRVALLTSLCDPQVLSHLLYQLFCFLNNIGTKYLPLANLIPIQRSSALPTVQGLEGRLLQTGLITIIIRELCKQRVFIPVGTILNSAGSKYILQHLVGSLCLPIYLRMISGAETQLRIQRIMQLLPEP
jgi:hypothetical protein